MNPVGADLASGKSAELVFVVLLLIAAQIPVALADPIPVGLQGSFVGQGDLHGRFEQRLGSGDTLLLRWPNLIDRAVPNVAINYEPADVAGRYRQGQAASIGADMNWARFRDGVLSSYRLRLQHGGGFILEIVHREAIAEGLRIRWTLLRDGDLVESGQGLAVKHAGSGVEG
jgi:hypothetical protein